MSTYTTSLGLERITPGDQAGLWGNTTNNNLNLIDQAITGVTPISFAALSGQTYTLTDFDGAVDEARSAVLNITGIAAGPNTVIIPNKQKTYLVRNNTGQNVVFQTPVPTATYTVGAGNSILIFCDGNNNVFTGIASPSVGTLSVSAGGTGSTTFTAGFVKSTGGTNALTSSTTVDLASEVSGVLPVVRGGTGAGTFTTGSLLIGNGTGNFGTLVGGTAGQVATWNGSQWTAQTPTTGGVNSVTAGTGISVTGTSSAPVIGLASLLTPGNYTNASISVSGSGVITAVSSGSSGGITAVNGTSGQIVANTSGSTVTLSLPSTLTSINTTGNAATATTAGTATNVSGGTVSATTGTFSGDLTANTTVKTNDITPRTSSTVTINATGSPTYAFNPSQFFPNVDGSSALGGGSQRWSIVYAVNGTINTSDANEKQQIRDISAAEKAVGLALKGKLKAFKFNDAVEKKGEGARIHFGIIAQEIKIAFEAEGLDPDKYGVFCRDTWYEVDGSAYDKDGYPNTKDTPNAIERTRLGVRYDQLYALILSAI